MTLWDKNNKLIIGLSDYNGGCTIAKMTQTEYYSHYRYKRCLKVNNNETSNIDNIPTEILREIFSILYNDGINTDRAETLEDLYSCIFVNKYWSANATPILWSNIIPSPGAITTYMAFFKEEERKELEKSGISFDNICDIESATYCYPSFLKSISMHELSLAIFLWCRNNCPQPITKQYNLLLRGILNIFANLCITLYQLDLDKRSLLDCLHHELWILLQEPNYRSFISRVKQLSLDIRKLVNDDCLELLCQTCQRLKILKIDMTVDETFWSSDNKLADIIKSQKGLQTFYLRRGKITPKIISALEVHAKSLKMLHFRRVDFEMCASLRSIFNYSNQLEVLIVRGCKNLSENVCEELMNTASFPNLVEVDFEDSDCEGLMSWSTIIKRHEHQNIQVV